MNLIPFRKVCQEGERLRRKLPGYFGNQEIKLYEQNHIPVYINESKSNNTRSLKNTRGSLGSKAGGKPLEAIKNIPARISATAFEALTYNKILVRV